MRLRSRAKLSFEIHTADGALPAGRRHGLHRAPRRAKAHRDVGPAVVIENRPGASTTIASEIVAKAGRPTATRSSWLDNHTINPSLVREAPVRHDQGLRARSPSPLTSSYVLVVHPSLPAKTVKELIALARSRKGEINYSSSGSSGPQHIAGELFKMMAKVDITHVPVQGRRAGVDRARRRARRSACSRRRSRRCLTLRQGSCARSPSRA